jgi:hypothetical protein
MTSLLERAHAAFAAQAWEEAFAAYTAAADEGWLGAEDNERLAVAAYLVGEDDACERAWEAAHRAALDAGDRAFAARCACWLALFLMLQGQMAKSNGWLARAERLIEDAGKCSASGYRLVPALLVALGAGDPRAARDLAVQATELGARFGDADLRAFGVLGPARRSSPWATRRPARPGSTTSWCRWSAARWARSLQGSSIAR